MLTVNGAPLISVSYASPAVPSATDRPTAVVEFNPNGADVQSMFIVPDGFKFGNETEFGLGAWTDDGSFKNFKKVWTTGPGTIDPYRTNRFVLDGTGIVGEDYKTANPIDLSTLRGANLYFFLTSVNEGVRVERWFVISSFTYQYNGIEFGPVKKYPTNFPLLIGAESAPILPQLAVQQPIDQVANAGDEVRFFTQANITATYQWWILPGGSTPTAQPTVIAGATSAMLIIPGAQAKDDGQYACVITDQVGEHVQTDWASLDVNSPAPKITEQPLSQHAKVGGTVRLHVAAVGKGTIGFQWFRTKGGPTGQPIPMATTDTLTIANASADDAGGYVCVVTNGTAVGIEQQV